MTDIPIYANYNMADIELQWGRCNQLEFLEFWDGYDKYTAIILPILTQQNIDFCTKLQFQSII